MFLWKSTPLCWYIQRREWVPEHGGKPTLRQEGPMSRVPFPTYREEICESYCVTPGRDRARVTFLKIMWPFHTRVYDLRWFSHNNQQAKLLWVKETRDPFWSFQDFLHYYYYYFSDNSKNVFQFLPCFLAELGTGPSLVAPSEVSPVGTWIFIILLIYYVMVAWPRQKSPKSNSKYTYLQLIPQLFSTPLGIFFIILLRKPCYYDPFSFLYVDNFEINASSTFPQKFPQLRGRTMYPGLYSGDRQPQLDIALKYNSLS